jgi:single-strand DNA-binding protein
MNTLRNKVNLIGRLGAKPEIQNLNGGFQLVKLAVATNERYKDKAGEWKDNTQWHNVNAWGKTAERLVKMADKGVEIALEGKLVNRQYETKSGEKRYVTEVEMSDFMILTPSNKTKSN